MNDRPMPPHTPCRPRAWSMTTCSAASATASCGEDVLVLGVPRHQRALGTGDEDEADDSGPRGDEGR